MLASEAASITITSLQIIRLNRCLKTKFMAFDLALRAVSLAGLEDCGLGLAFDVLVNITELMVSVLHDVTSRSFFTLTCAGR